MESEEKILVSPTEAMKILGVSRCMLYDNLLKRDDFPAFRIKGCSRYFINRQLLQKWADKQCIDSLSGARH